MDEAINPHIARAKALAAEGRLADSRAELERAAVGADADCAALLATLLLTGQPFGRDLTASRTWFKAAADLGHKEGTDASIAFTANGTGGNRDWPAALAALRSGAAAYPAYAEQVAVLDAMSLDANGDPAGLIRCEPIAELPGAFLFPDFLSSVECRYLIDAANPALAPSLVIDPRTGGFVADPIRRSDVAPFPLVAENPVIHALNRRIARASGTKVEQGEPLQVLRYAQGQEYRQHLDAIPGAENQREITFLIYLNEGYSGGETSFPKAGLEVRGRTGMAFLFHNTVDGEPDSRTAHIGQPVTEGVKFLASRWIRARPLDLSL